MNLKLANPGGRLYPVSVCLQMVLTFKEERYQVYEVENISGHPYGWFYLNELISGTGCEVEITPGTELTNSIKIAADNLGYKFVHCLTDNWFRMEEFIKQELRNKNPIIYGPISYKRLTYQIGAHRATEIASHYVVLIGFDDENVYFHDPNGMSYVKYSFDQLKNSCTIGVLLPKMAKFSAIVLKEKVKTFNDFEIFKNVVKRGVNCYENKQVRKNAFIGLQCLQKYANDITQWLGARNKLQREMVMRKLGLFFYPKSNQMRADAITYMQKFRDGIKEISNEIDKFCSVLTDACILYYRGASIITPNLINFNENKMEKILELLRKDALELYKLETEAYEQLQNMNFILKGGD